jgi:radical SAM superfamily enzyme YgiQ (UPF0313 family)
MRITFLEINKEFTSPAFAVERKAVKLAIPTITGYLSLFGYDQIRHYDFEIEPFAYELAHPGAFDLNAFRNEDLVTDFMQPVPSELSQSIRNQVELFVQTLAVEEAELFALSCANTVSPNSFEDNRLLGNMAMCLARRLKERFPSAKTLIGGGRNNSPDIQAAEGRHFLERCPWLDFAAVGGGEALTLHLVQHLEGKTSFEDNRQVYEEVGYGVLLFPDRAIQVPADWMPAVQKGSRRFDADGVALPLAPEVPPALPPGWVCLAPMQSAAYIPPHFERRLLDSRRFSGRALLDFYDYPAETVADLVPYHERGSPVVPLMFLSGCTSRCAFCCYSRVGVEARHPKEVVRDIARLRDQLDGRYFHFLNTNINASPDYADAFADALLEARLDILWSDSVNFRWLDDRLLEKLQRSGLSRIVVGLECASDRLLKHVDKRLTVAQAFSRLRAAHELGIWTHLQFIPGLPTETEDDIRATVEFIERTNEYANAYSLSPFFMDPTSRMAKNPERFGVRLIPTTYGELDKFEEIGGLNWEEKQAQIAHSTEMMRQAIIRAKGDVRYLDNHLHLDLFFWLYDCF